MRTAQRPEHRPGPDDDNSPDDSELVRLVQSLPPGDRQREEAYSKLIDRYQPLVRGCAARYARSPEPLEELMQAGYIGLVNAINHFDAAFGNSLQAYARPCISGEIKRHFRDKRWQLRVYRAAQELRAQVLQGETELTQRLGRPPAEDEIASYLRLSPEDVQEARGADRAFHTVSLDAPVSGEPDAGTLGETLGTEDAALEKAPDVDALWVYLAELPERDQKILCMRFYGNMSQTQIGDKLGISQMHVSRLLAQALETLRARMLDAEPTAV